MFPNKFEDDLERMEDYVRKAASQNFVDDHSKTDEKFSMQINQISYIENVSHSSVRTPTTILK